MNQADVQYPIPDKSQIAQSLVLILTTPDANLRKQADRFLADYEQNNPLITLTLLEIFETEQDFLLRLQALILLKNIIVRQWNKSKLLESKRMMCIPDPLKTQIKEKLSSYLGLITDLKLKNEFDLCIEAVARHEFPANFPALVSYLVQGLMVEVAELQQTPEQQHCLVLQKPIHVNLFKTLKGVLKEQQKKRLGQHKKQTFEFVSQIWQQLQLVWECTSKQFVAALGNPAAEVSDVNFLAVFSKDIDRILATAVLSSHTDLDLYLFYNQLLLSENVSKVFVHLLSKVAAMMQVTPHASVYLLVQANLKTLVHSLSNIQQVYPLSIVSHFNDYLAMLKIIVQGKWQDTRLLKAGVLGFMKVLKCFNYYSTPMQFQKTIHGSQLKVPQLQELQQQVHLMFQSYFSTECGSLLELMIGVTGVAEGLDDEDLLEQEEDNYTEDVKSELQCSIYNLALSCTEQLFLRYPQVTFQNIQGLLTQLQQNNYQFHNATLLDSIFAVVGLLPRIIQRLGMKKEELRQVVNIISILQFLSQQSTKSRLRRCAILAGRYILCLEQNEMIELVKLVLYLVCGQEDRIVQYEGLMCIKTMVQGLNDDPTQQIQWSAILEQIAPPVVQLLENFQKANIVWPLLQLLQKLIQKTQYQSLETLRQTFERANLINLVSTTSELLVGSLCDMLKSLVVSFPPNTSIPHIYNLIFTLVECNVKSKNISVFKLWLFAVQEYSSIQGLDQRVNSLFVNNFDTLVQESDLSNMVEIIFLFEEHILMQVIPYSGLANIVVLVEQRLQIANQIETHDEALQIKNACLNIVSTMVLLVLNQKKPEDLAMFQNILVLILQDFLRVQNERQLTHILIYKTQSVSILNRFIIQDFASFVSLLASYQISFDDYFLCWLKNTNYLSSRNSRKLNMIALLIALPKVSTQLLLKNLELVLKECFPEIHQYTETRGTKHFRLKQKGPLKNAEQARYFARLGDFKVSERKELLRHTQLYDEVNMIEFFQRNIKLTFEVHQLNEETIRAHLTDQTHFAKLLALMSAV